MPQRKGKQSKQAGRRNKRGPRSGVGNMTLQGAFPPRKIVKLNYSDIFTLTEAAAGAGVHQVLRTGDVYDPDFTGLGHQPMYFDQLCTSAGPYLLHSTPSAVFHLRFINTSSVPVLLVVAPSMVTTVPSNRTQAAEKPYAWRHVCPPVGTGGAMVEHRLSLDNVKFTGVQRQTYIADYSGNFGTAAACPNLIISVYGLGATVATVTLSATVVYNTMFYQLGPTGTS